jgi:sulfide:quinone oxidoreductase
MDSTFSVVVAGGGVAAVEAVLALRAAAGKRVEIELVAPADELVHRPLSVLEPFGDAPAIHLAFSRLEATHGVRHHRDSLAAVDTAARRAILARDGDLAYDALIVATGARADAWLPSALTFSGSADAPAYRELLAALSEGRAAHVLFVVPPHVAWSLPLYELALLTAGWLAEHEVIGARLTLATPDPEPLRAFGASASRAVRDLLGDRGIELVAGVPTPRDVRGGIELGRLGRLRPDRIVTLPRLVGHPPAGLPSDADGFVPVDAHGAVPGAEGVYVVGDAADHAIKQGGLATQQADTAATAIAASLGLPVRVRPFEAVLRGVLLTGVTSAYLREGATPHPRVTYATSWTAPLKVAARHLSAYVASGDDPGGHEVGLRQAVEFAHADARWGDFRSALEWLAVAERIGGALEPGLARERERWERELEGAGAAR